MEPPGRELCWRIAIALSIEAPELWRYAFVSRARRWLLKEGYVEVDSRRLLELFHSIEERRDEST